MTYKKLSEEQRIDHRIRAVRFECDSLKYVLIFGFVMLILWSTMITNKIRQDRADISLEERILSISKNVVENSEVFMNETASQLEILARENRKISDDHIERVETVLNGKKKDILLRMKDIMAKAVADVEQEVASFTGVIEEAVRGIIEYLIEDSVKIVERVDWASAANVSEIVPIALSDMEYAVTGAFVDLDSMYSFYDDYVLRFVDDRANNGTRKLSLFMNSNRKRYDDSIDENVRVCYQIGSQNYKLIDRIDRCLGVIDNVLKASQIIVDLNIELSNDDDDDNTNSTTTCAIGNPWLKEAQLIVNQEFFKINNRLNDVINDNRYFVGTEVTTRSLSAHAKMRDNILRQLKKSIFNFDKSVNVTTTQFAIVRDDHWPIIKDGTDNILSELRKSISAKIDLTNDTKLTTEWKRKSEFADLKVWMERKFANNTFRINEDFEKRKSYFGRQLKDSVTFVNDNIVPVMSILHIDNYIPNECSIGVVFQKFVNDILSDYLTDSCTKPTYNEHQRCMKSSNTIDNTDIDNNVFLASFDVTEFMPFAKFVQMKRK